MTASTRSRIAGTSRAAAAPLIFITIAVGFLLRFPPTQYSFYPQCPIYHYLHIQCPGCGSTRAIAALLHGNLIEALRLNTLTTLLVPPAVIYLSLCYRRFLQRKLLHRLQPPVSAIYSALVVAGIFTLIRNLGHI